MKHEMVWLGIGLGALPALWLLTELVWLLTR